MIIDIKAYLIIGIILSILTIIRYILKDLEDGKIWTGEIIVDVANGFIIGLSWIISMPIFIVTNIILAMIMIFYREEDDDNE